MLKSKCAKCQAEHPDDMMHEVVGQAPVVGQVRAKVCAECVNEIFSSPPISMGCSGPTVDDKKMKSFFKAIEESPDAIMHGTIKPTKKEN